ncbi:hypothetical protein TrVFT333_005828 [Trichoderma virens FT-333]|nr:hypothetical protein TrVFT333_005828 [Trichoderma virens FT-333]
MQDELLPSEIEQVESLILSLYEPASPSTISKTQATLSRLQGSPQAWSLAHHLLGRPDEKVKFFGALTIIVKLNTESASLSDGDATELLVSLLECNILEDVTRIDLNAASNVGLYDSVLANTSDSVTLITMCMNRDGNSPEVKQDALRCLQSWVNFAQKTSARNSYIADSLRPLIGGSINALMVEDLYNAAAELLIDVLFNWPSLFTEQHYTALSNVLDTAWFHNLYDQLIQGDGDFEATQLGYVLLAFGEARIQVLIQDDNDQNRNILSRLCGLLAADGYPVAENKIFVPAIEFWSTFTEFVSDMEMESTAASSITTIMIPYIFQATSHAWKKIIYPPADEFHSWDSVDRIGFNDARKDVVDLLQAVYKLVATASLDCISREKIVGALASIAQAIPEDDERYTACSGLLAFIQDDVQKSMTLVNITNDEALPQQIEMPCTDIAPQEHVGLHVALRALRCLASMGKGLQSPPEFSIDLEAVSPQKVQTPKLVELQKQVIGIIIEVQNVFKGSSEVTELICSVLRSGFSETEPGPFVLTPEDINGIDLVSRLLTRSPGTFIGLEPSDAIEFFFLFTLQVLDGKEPLPKAAAAEFWTAFVGARGDEAELQETFQRAMDTLGPLLSQSLARNIGGNALRSELDRLCEPLRKLVSRYPMAKDWLQSGLDHPSFPSEKVSAEQKSLFVKKIISLRGSRTTNQVVRDFWLSARGANFAYAS